MDRLDPRHGNAREAEGGRVAFLFLYVLIESPSFVPIYLPEWKGWRSRLLLALAFISEALGIVKSDSRSK